MRVKKAALQVLTSPPFIPPHRGRGDGTFYEFVNLKVIMKNPS